MDITRFSLAAFVTLAACRAPEPPRDALTPAAPPARRALAASPDPHPQFAAKGISCATCHPCGAAPVHTAAWMDPLSDAFHALAANAGLTPCRSCHGANLDGVGGTSAVSCAACHGESWKTSCTLCHGGTDNQTGAPPKTTWGRDADLVRSGAHTAHVAPRLAQPIACAACHVTPQDALSAGHIDGQTATVTLAGTGSWDRASATCSSTECHGAALLGGLRKNPVWTLTDGTQRSCDACHGAPPPEPHAQSAECGTCHPGYGPGTVQPATHVDGKLDVSLDCASCHGDRARAATPLNPQLAAAPPVGTHGETATSTTAVGAHQRHLLGGPLTNGIACDECHAVPTGFLHRDGTVQVRFGPLATTRASSPVWNRTSNTCSANWCHGAKLSGGRDTTPVWTTVNGTQAACGTCHGLPPWSGEHGKDDHRVSCGYCHGGTYTQSVADKSRHVNGIFEVNGPRIRSWNPSTRTCQPTCHGTETWN